ncbi:hypothetical protein B566_EDAN005937 [Ephemera danica]|nr:hypothetical protein B566_EDAN005937 [Ephemera danica]
MALRLCKELNPLLTDDNLQRLNSRKIYTILDLLDEPHEKITEFTQIPKQDVLDLRDSLIANFSSFYKDGLSIYKDMTHNSAIISSNIPRLDAVLNGGLMTGELLEVYGFSGCGKTQLCLTLTASAAARLKAHVYYIDCKNDFSGTRLQSILYSQGVRDEELGMAMERVQVVRPTSIHQLLTSLPYLHQQIQQKQNTSATTRLLIIDSLCSLLYPLIGDSSKMCGLLVSLGIALRQLACQLELCVVLVNLAKHWYDAEQDEAAEELPALGKVWFSFPNSRLHMTAITDRESCVRVSVSKSTRIPCNRSCVLKISSKGVE